MSLSQRDAESYLKLARVAWTRVLWPFIQWVLALYPNAIFTGERHATQVPNPYGQVPWLDDNPATPNPEFFKHVDHLVDVAERLGLEETAIDALKRGGTIK